MDFTRCTIPYEELDYEESKANLYRRRDELYEARAIRDSTLGENYPRVCDFYKGRHVFVTGASGFIGKVFVEKLLRMCPDIGNVYVLLRTRRGQDPRTRLKAMMEVPLFDLLRETNPSAIEKVVAITGDCLEEGLGIGPADRQMLVERVSVIIHSAASVRFTDPIERAVRLNLRSSIDVVELAREMKNLKVLVHVSTAYCFTNHNPTLECVYQTDHEWRDVLKYAALPDSDKLDLLGDKFLGFQPNSYSFTKALAERVMNEAALDLPVVIVRPPIVTCAQKEPLPGWMDNLNGFAMFWAVASKGVLRFNYVKSEHTKYDLVPVDVVATALILASWAKGTHQSLPISSENVEVISISFMDVKPTTPYLMQIILRKNLDDKTVGYSGAVRYPRYGVTTNRLLGKVLVFFYHLVFGFAVDIVLKAIGRKPMLMPIYRKMTFAIESLQYFQQKEFHFQSDNFWRVLQMAHPKDRKYFDMDFETDWRSIGKAQLAGVAKYALKEKMDSEDIEKNCRQINRLWWAELCWYIFLAALAVWLLAWKFS